MDELELEALLEAPYVNGGKQEEPKSAKTESSSSSAKKRSRSRSGSRHRSGSKRDGDRDRGSRDDRDRDRNRDDRRGGGADFRRDDRRRDDGRGNRDRRDDRRDRDHGDRGNRRSRSRDRNQRRSRSRSRDGGDDRRRGGRGRGGGSFRNRSMSPIRKPDLAELTPEERDARTVVCMQLASRIRSEDLEEFFSAVGKVAEVRLVTDRKRKSKGIAYVEFVDVESVPLAIALTGQKLLGVPIVVQMSHAEKNRLAAMQAAAAAAARETGVVQTVQGFIPGAAKLYVGSLHYNITEDMLRAIFEPFGKLLDVSIVKDQKTTQSQGFAFLTFRNAEDASVALVQMNGFPLAGRPLKVGRSERSACFPDVSEMDKFGAMLTTTGGAGSEALNAATAAASVIGSLPQLQDPLAGMPVGITDPGIMPGFGLDAQLGLGAMSGYGMNPMGLGMPPGFGMAPPPAAPPVAAAAPPINTECLLVSNLFDPNMQMQAGWDTALSDDIVRECGRHGAAVTHIAVDRASVQGNVYVKCESMTAAVAAVTALHGRYFDGRLVTVAYVPAEIYHSLFPDAARQAPGAASTALATTGSTGMRQ